MVKSYYLAGAASAICVVLITFAASSAIFLLNDINSFYSEAQEELVEFKDLANNVWDYMIYDASPEELREAEEMDKQREERIKRSYDDLSGYGRDPIVVPSTTQTVPPLTKISTASEPQEETGYDFPSQETGPPSSRPKKPEPPTMPRIIQGFRAPPPAATSTIKPPFLSNQNYNKPRISNYYNNGREPARPFPSYHPGNTPSPYNPIPNTQNPPQPGGEDDVATLPPNWPKVYNTRRPGPGGPNYPNDGYETPGRNGGTTRGPYVFSTVGNERPGNPPLNPLNPPFPTLAPNQNTQRPGNYPSGTTRSPGNYDESGRPLPPNNNRIPPLPNYGNDKLNPTTQPPIPPPTRVNPNSRNPTGRYPEDQLNPNTRNPTGPSRTNLPRFPIPGRNPRPGPNQNQCDMCGQQPNVCPPGPVGPRGRPGPPGFPGQDGPRGLRGLNGDHVETPNTPNYDPIIGCIQCPLGPPGERGADGPQGPPGEDGTDGEAGYNGKDGNPGAPGAPGHPGMRGTPGRPGKPGTPGRMGHACRSVPGPPGAPGTAGLPGRAGDPGIDGEHGQDGSPGIQGPPGRDGEPGADGLEGQSRPGPPGTDAGYCPCPKRSSKYEVPDEGSYHEKPPVERPRDRGYPEQHESDYERPRHQNKYDTSAAVPERDREYENSERIRPRTGGNRDNSADIPDRKPAQYESEDNYRPSQPSKRVHVEPRRQQPESRREYEEMEAEINQRPPPPPPPPPAPTQREYENEGEHHRRPQPPLKKVEIPGKHANGHNNKPRYEESAPRAPTPEYSAESSYEDEERRKSAHPPGIRFRRPHPPHHEEEMPRVRKTERYEGEEPEQGYEGESGHRKGRYEDISKNKKGAYDSDNNDRQVVESRSRKPHERTSSYSEPQYDNRPSHVSSSKDQDQEQPYSSRQPQGAKSSKSNYDSESAMDKQDNSEYPSDSTSAPLPSEPLPYRRRLRFYRNKYYEKYLA